MHLKRLLLTGFKTFAEKTEIEFSQGVTAIVGPNGSGKSNIADAVLWVLGEQKASAVRGTKTQDVIFAGSAKRKPLGLAEVSLTVDNSDRALPVAFDEVTITRRAYRSGEGEYFLNKTPCRLRDLYELFLDTGVGREAYALVNQSEIDSVLSADPEVRRGLFEEAAGIKKYRVKKREALKKLEATEANLTRVRDIMCEIEDQIEPLRSQADLATRYLGLKERLGQIERDHLIAELRLADYEMCAAAEARAEDESSLAAHSRRLAAAEERAGDLAGLLTQAETNLDSCRQRHQSALTAEHEAKSRREIALQRMEGLNAQLVMLAQEVADLDERLSRIDTQAGEDSASLLAARTEQTELAGALAVREAEGKALTAEIAALTRREEERRQQALRQEREAAERRAELARAEARLAEAEAALPALKAEIEESGALVSELNMSLDAAKKRQRDAEGEAEQASACVREARSAREAAGITLQAAQKDRDAIRVATLSLRARYRSLMELEEAQEGYYSGVRSVLSAARAGTLAGEFMVVADSFTAPPGYETAFEVALGSSLQDIITDTEEAAKRAIEHLKRTKAGRATFLPLNRMRPPRSELRVGIAQQYTGYLGPALSILDFDERYRPALEVLLGRVLVSETLDDALKVSEHASGWGRIVTLAGELVLPTGALTGGALSRKGAPILERKTEIAALGPKLAASEDAEAEQEAALAAAGHASEEANKSFTLAEQAAGASTLAIGGARQDVERAEREIGQAGERIAAQKNRLGAAEVSLAQLREAVTASAAKFAGDAEERDRATTRADGTEQLRELAVSRDETTAEITRLRIALAALAERASGLARSERAVRAEREGIEAARTRRVEREKASEEELARLAELAGESEAAEEAARLASEAAHREMTAAQTHYQELRDRSQEAAAAVRLIGEQRGATIERIRKSELAEARSQMQRSQLAARLLEEYDITAEYALSLDHDPDVPSDTPREVSRLRRELRGLGEVNTGAAEEFARLTERYEFLGAQRADLEEAKAKIADAIREIDESTRDVFMKTYHEVGVAFDEIFKRLFNGGSTQLTLTQPDNLLETGVEIAAQPPGKKRQNLALLSGGERALTAAALLFAFLKVRPAPFCVLDEIDAPLDGANVERFADLLSDFGSMTQFLVITHNPTTMEAAPIWYGVTMQEAGISRILSLAVPPAATGRMREAV